MPKGATLSCHALLGTVNVIDARYAETSAIIAHVAPLQLSCPSGILDAVGGTQVLNALSEQVQILVSQIPQSLLIRHFNLSVKYSQVLQPPSPRYSNLPLSSTLNHHLIPIA